MNKDAIKKAVKNAVYGINLFAVKRRSFLLNFERIAIEIGYNEIWKKLGSESGFKFKSSLKLSSNSGKNLFLV